MHKKTTHKLRLWVKANKTVNPRSCLEAKNMGVQNTVSQCGSLLSSNYGTCSATSLHQTVSAPDAGNNLAGLKYSTSAIFAAAPFQELTAATSGYCGFGDQPWGSWVVFNSDTGLTNFDYGYAAATPYRGFITNPTNMYIGYGFGNPSYQAMETTWQNTFSSFFKTIKGINFLMHMDGRNNSAPCVNKKITTLRVRESRNLLPVSCLDAKKRGSLNTLGNTGDGIYSIDPDGYKFGLSPVDVQCDMTNGGWTMVAKIQSTNRNHAVVGSVGTSPSDAAWKLSDTMITAIPAYLYKMSCVPPTHPNSPKIVYALKGQAAWNSTAKYGYLPIYDSEDLTANLAQNADATLIGLWAHAISNYDIAWSRTNANGCSLYKNFNPDGSGTFTPSNGSLWVK